MDSDCDAEATSGGGGRKKETCGSRHRRRSGIAPLLCPGGGRQGAATPATGRHCSLSRSAVLQESASHEPPDCFSPSSLSKLRQNNRRLSQRLNEKSVELRVLREENIKLQRDLMNKCESFAILSADFRCNNSALESLSTIVFDCVTLTSQLGTHLHSVHTQLAALTQRQRDSLVCSAAAAAATSTAIATSNSTVTSTAEKENDSATLASSHTVNRSSLKRRKLHRVLPSISGCVISHPSIVLSRVVQQSDDSRAGLEPAASVTAAAAAPSDTAESLSDTSASPAAEAASSTSPSSSPGSVAAPSSPAASAAELDQLSSCVQTTAACVVPPVAVVDTAGDNNSTSPNLNQITADPLAVADVAVSLSASSSPAARCPRSAYVLLSNCYPASTTTATTTTASTTTATTASDGRGATIPPVISATADDRRLQPVLRDDSSAGGSAHSAAPARRRRRQSSRRSSRSLSGQCVAQETAPADHSTVPGGATGATSAAAGGATGATTAAADEATATAPTAATAAAADEARRADSGADHDADDVVAAGAAAGVDSAGADSGGQENGTLERVRKERGVRTDCNGGADSVSEQCERASDNADTDTDRAGGDRMTADCGGGGGGCDDATEADVTIIQRHAIVRHTEQPRNLHDYSGFLFDTMNSTVLQNESSLHVTQSYPVNESIAENVQETVESAVLCRLNEDRNRSARECSVSFRDECVSENGDVGVVSSEKGVSRNKRGVPDTREGVAKRAADDSDDARCDKSSDFGDDTVIVRQKRQDSVVRPNNFGASLFDDTLNTTCVARAEDGDSDCDTGTLDAISETDRPWHTTVSGAAHSAGGGGDVKESDIGRAASPVFSSCRSSRSSSVSRASSNSHNGSDCGSVQNGPLPTAKALKHIISMLDESDNEPTHSRQIVSVCDKSGCTVASPSRSVHSSGECQQHNGTADANLSQWLYDLDPLEGPSHKAWNTDEIRERRQQLSKSRQNHTAAAVAAAAAAAAFSDWKLSARLTVDVERLPLDLLGADLVPNKRNRLSIEPIGCSRRSVSPIVCHSSRSRRDGRPLRSVNLPLIVIDN